MHFEPVRAWGNMSFYDAVHSEGGELHAAQFSIWQMERILRDISVPFPDNFLYLRFEDTMSALLPTVEKILSFGGIPVDLYDPISHHMCLRQRSLFDTSERCEYNDLTHISNPEMKESAIQEMHKDSSVREMLDSLKEQVDGLLPCVSANCGRHMPESHKTCAMEVLNKLYNPSADSQTSGSMP